MDLVVSTGCGLPSGSCSPHFAKRRGPTGRSEAIDDTRRIHATPSTLAESLGKGDRVMVTGRLRQRSWETPEGDKRSLTELEADEVGASLKWATAKVERSSQRGNGDRAQGGSGRPNAAGTSTTSHRLRGCFTT
jgi:hypothetical protein